MNQKDVEPVAPSSDQPEEAPNMPDHESNDSSSSKGITRLNAMESKMDQMSKEIQLLQKEKAQIKAENEKLRQRMDAVQVRQIKQEAQAQDQPHAVLIADSHIASKSKSTTPSATPNNNSNKKSFAAVICCLLVVGAIIIGVVYALRKDTESPALAPVSTNSPTAVDNQATMVPTIRATSVPEEPPSTSLERISFAVDQVQEGGRVFTVPADSFPLFIDGSENNPSKRTTIRMLNKRTNVIKGVMLELVTDEQPATSISRSSHRAQQVVRGYYNPKEYTQPGDFAPRDDLVAVDYEPFIPAGFDPPFMPPACARQDNYEILRVHDDLGWNADPESIRIGRLGVVGSWYEDFEYIFHVGDQPVQALWTDAVDIDIEYTNCNHDCSLSYSSRRLVPSRHHRSLRYFPNGPVSGTVRILFKGASFTNLNGLVTHRDSGGLHVTFCTESGNGMPLTTIPTFSPTTGATMDRYAAATNALLEGGVYYPLGEGLDWLTNVDTFVPTQSFQWVERYALVLFFKRTNGDQWSKNYLWMEPGVDVCNWEGITCNRNGAVMELDLRNVGVTGTLPLELYLLSNLSRLKFQNDPMIAEDGRIPSAILQLSNLKTLFMRDCGINKIGEEITFMSNLENLLLRGNRLFSTIPEDIFALTKLTSLNLKECSLQEQIPSGISLLSDLEVLDVSVNTLRAPMPQELAFLPRLRRLVAGQNPWAMPFPIWFSQMTALDQLYLAFSNLQGTIPSEIAQMTSLTFLTVNQNSLTGSIPPLPVSLERCNMNNNQFSDTRNRGPCTVAGSGGGT